MMKRWMHGEGKKTAIALLLLAATPFTAFFLMQWIYAGSLLFILCMCFGEMESAWHLFIICLSG